MKKVLRVLGIFFVVYLLDQHTAVNRTFISLLYILTWVYAGYLIVKFYAREKKTVENTQVEPPVRKPDVLNPATVQKKSYTGVIVVILLILAFVFIKFLGIISINFILFMNRLLHVTSLTSAIFLWALTGLFVGMIYGTFVAWKKYRLHFTINVFPIAAFAIFIALMFFINAPLKPSARTVSTTEDAFRFISVRSSGYLPAYKMNSFADSNLVDSDDKTTWIENAKNAGVGEWIEFSFNTAPRIDNYKSFMCIGFHIKNGYAQSEKLWASHNRLKEFRVSHNGNTIGTVMANDYFNQREAVSIKPFPVKFNDVVTIHINSVYYGNKNTKLTAITELVPIVEIVE